MKNEKKINYIPATKKSPYLKRIGIYARVSTARKEQLQSLSNQVSALTNHVYQRNDWILRDVYMDIGSAKTGSYRREFWRMLNDCKENKLDYIVTKSLSRFGRDIMEVIETMRQLTDLGVKVYFVEENLDVDNIYGEFALSIGALINQAENEQRGENIKLGLKFGAQSGKSGLYRKVCYGYIKNDAGKLVPEQEQAAVVKYIYQMYLDGKSFGEIINTLAEEQISSPRGSEKWSKKAIETILTNIKYTGNVEVMKADVGRESYMMWNSHEAIISENMFDEVQREISKRAKRKGKEERLTIAKIRAISVDRLGEKMNGKVNDGRGKNNNYEKETAEKTNHKKAHSC